MPSKPATKESGAKNHPKSSSSKTTLKTSPTTNVKSTEVAGNYSQAPDIADLRQPLIRGPQDDEPSNQESTDQTPQSAMESGAKEAGVNKKKQKRRMKEAARKAAEQPQQEHGEHMAAGRNQGVANGYDCAVSDYDDPDQYEPDEADDIYYTDEATQRKHSAHHATGPPQRNGHVDHDYVPHEPHDGKAKKKKKTKSGSMSRTGHSPAISMSHPSQGDFQRPPPPPPPPLGQNHTSAASRSAHHVSKDRIWNTSTAEERERIKEFWLSLGEEDRRSLVKVEKEAVLRKMKEQQRHSCSCTVCGRKRTAIEEELEVLYDAYYLELEQYANHQQVSYEDGTPMIKPPRLYPHPMARPPPLLPQITHRRSSRGRIQEIGEEDDAGDEEDYSEEDENDELSDEDIESERMGPATDFFNFGNSLTVQGGILTVADDLLKNDGKKFIEMMEQLAERRMQREEDAQYAAQGMRGPHGHSGRLDDDGYDDEEEEEEDEEEYDSQEEDEFEEDDMETMTEEQRMEEGRRMFQIFAARMFEQRVLTAYREKVALERQQKLIEELDDESRVDAQREAKKAKEAQKKKDKKRQQKQAKDEERAKREAEKAAEEAAAKALEEKKAQELRQKKEEQRRKKEAEKKAQEEEKQRKEAEKQRRQQEAKEQQAEAERKQREQKEREKKKREEVKKKEREEREAKEKEAREKKERETKAEAAQEVNQRNREQVVSATKSSAPTAQLPKKPSPASAPSTFIPPPPGLHAPHTTSSHASPHRQIATPVVPKAPTPVRPRQMSLQTESRNTSPKTSLPPTNSATSPSVSSVQQSGTNMFGKSPRQQAHQQQPQQGSRYSPTGALSGVNSQATAFSNMPTSRNGFPTSFGPPVSPLTQQAPINPATNPSQSSNGVSQFRNFMAPNGMPFPPGMNGARQMPQGRVAMDSMASQPSMGSLPSANHNDIGHFGMSRDAVPPHSHSHSRNTSTSSNIGAQTQPIARPAPIRRPSSVTPHQHSDNRATSEEIDDLSNHLGSKALLDGASIDDNSPTSSMDGSHRPRMAVGGPRAAWQGFGNAPGFPDPIGTTRMEYNPRGTQVGNGNTWSNSQMPFGAPPMSGPPSWSNPPGFGRPTNGSAFGSIGGSHQPSASRAITIRMLARTACEKLTARAPMGSMAGRHRVDDVLREVQSMRPAHEQPVNTPEMLEICEMEGNTRNGGGSFDTQLVDQVGLLIHFDPGRHPSVSGNGGAPGDIGSPIIGGGALPAIGGQRSFQQHGGFPPSAGF